MESVDNWPFDIGPDTAVVTTKHITHDGALVVLVTHEYDEDEGAIWQFHSDNEDYQTSALMLVRLDELLELDATLYSVANLPMGYAARRIRKSSIWQISKLSES